MEENDGVRVLVPRGGFQGENIREGRHCMDRYVGVNTVQIDVDQGLCIPYCKRMVLGVVKLQIRWLVVGGLAGGCPLGIWVPT